MKIYSQTEVSEQLDSMPGWSYKNGNITKAFSFKQFMDGIRFVTAVAEAAEAADHHPDIDIRYTIVTVALSTHSAGGITDNDFRLAEVINKLY